MEYIQKFGIRLKFIICNFVSGKSTISWASKTKIHNFATLPQRVVMQISYCYFRHFVKQFQTFLQTL